MAFRAASKGRADAVLVLEGPVFISQRIQVADLALKSRLPVIYAVPENVEAGGLMTYGVSFNDLHRRTVIYVDKILKLEAGRPASRAADKVRANHQSQRCQTDGSDDSACRADTGGQGHKMTVNSWQQESRSETHDSENSYLATGKECDYEK
jgi:hypothetical protein